MAVWQFELDPIPAHRAAIDGVPAIHLSNEAREVASIVFSPSERKEFIRALDALLPRQQAWGSGIMMWGNTRATDVQFFHDDGGADEVHIRINARIIRHDLIEAICGLAIRFDWVFLTDDGAVLLPRAETVLRSLLNSPARRFVEDPGSMLTRAAERVYEPAS